MISFSNPSYLYQSRHDIYYFRVRIPKFIQNKYHISRKEFRNSLKTRCYSTALSKARRLWVELEDTDYMMKPEGHERELWEENEGRKLLKELLLADIITESDDNYFAD